MSCSKLGNLPELTYEVIKYLQNDYSTLHSCVLVNRLWCRLAIPLLWENPFSIPTENYNFIEIYLHNLNGELKTKFNEHEINENLLPSNTLFNYPSFIKYLDLLKISISVGEWFYTAKIKNLDLVKDTTISLLKIFIENEVNLHTLEIKINHYYITYFKDILELTLQNPNFIRNAKNFELSILTRFRDNSTLIDNLILQVIKLHQNLKKVILSYYNLPFYQSLLLSKDYNCSNTLNTITLYHVNFKVINLIENIKQNLNCLSINCGESSLDNNSSILLQNLGQILPSKLEYLDLTLYIKVSDFKVFLKNSQGTFIKKLLIRDLKQKVNCDLLPHLKKYIMKEKRVRYLNFRNLHKELFDYRDIVKEFKSHNIRVQKYNDLHFDMYQLMQKLD
ncbi:unnamed protein product [Rhizophagus irregularis]|nr:unnamed protein product [Rhizophagus irregularis]